MEHVLLFPKRLNNPYLLIRFGTTVAISGNKTMMPIANRSKSMKGVTDL